MDKDFTINNLLLETDRLLLKVVDAHCAKQVLEYYRRNQQFLEQWEPVRDEEFYTLRSQQESLASDLDKMQSGTLFRVWLFKKTDGLSQTIGCIGLNNIVRGAFQSCHLGYKLDGAEINRGYMSEALQAVIQYAFTVLQLHRIEANIIPRNLRSLRVIQKLGFYNEGLAKKYLRINGKWEDHIHMVLLNEAME